MHSLPKISETEWEIMRIIWAQNPISAAEVIEKLAAADASWHPKTVRTLLSRLVQKKALDYKPQGRAYVYTPRVTEEECVEAASESFLDRVFGGALKPMLAHFVERRKLSKKEMEDLRNLLNSQEEKNAKRR